MLTKQACTLIHLNSILVRSKNKNEKARYKNSIKLGDTISYGVRGVDLLTAPVELKHKQDELRLHRGVKLDVFA